MSASFVVVYATRHPLAAAAAAHTAAAAALPHPLVVEAEPV